MPSDVWKFFTKEGKGCICNLCGNEYKNSGNKTNLRKHLKSKHYHAFVDLSLKDESLEKENNAPSTVNNNASTTRSRSRSPIISASQFRSRISIQDSNEKAKNLTELREQEDAETSSTSTGTCATTFHHSDASCSQHCLYDIFTEQRAYADGGSKEAAITQALLYMICKDGRPLSCVENEGMKQFLKTAVPLYTPKSIQAMTCMMENKYEALAAVVSKSIADVNHLSLTTDISTLVDSNKSCIVLTGHYIDEASASIQSFCLGAKQLHTAEKLDKNLAGMLDEFKVDKSKIVSVTTDGRASVVAAIGTLLGSSSFHVPCLERMINLVVEDAIDAVPAFKENHEKVKALIAYFKSSRLAIDDLRAEQEDEEKSEETFLYLIQVVTTRWDSAFYALKRFVTLSGHVRKILLSSEHENAPSMLTPTEVDAIRECINVLKPFEAAIKEISGGKYSSASMVIPIANCVRGNLQKIAPESKVARQLKFQLEEKIKRLLADLEKTELLSIAMILDPRFKTLHFQSPKNASYAIESISRQVFHQLRVLSERKSSSPDDEATDDLWSHHDKKAAEYCISESPSPTGQSLPNELELYLQIPYQALASNPIKFWRDCKNTFPGTYRIAMKYLTVSGTSVLSEQAVSRLNGVASDTTSHLSSAHKDMLLFLGSLDEKLWFP